MYCKKCGSEVNEGAMFCSVCGNPTSEQRVFCNNCGAEQIPGATTCDRCGSPINSGSGNYGKPQKSKLAAGLFGILLGGFGVHNFYLGFIGKGVAQIILTVCCFGVGGIWGLIEGIMILTGSIDRDAEGVPLKD